MVYNWTAMQRHLGIFYKWRLLATLACRLQQSLTTHLLLEGVQEDHVLVLFALCRVGSCPLRLRMNRVNFSSLLAFYFLCNLLTRIFSHSWESCDMGNTTLLFIFCLNPIAIFYMFLYDIISKGFLLNPYFQNLEMSTSHIIGKWGWTDSLSICWSNPSPWLNLTVELISSPAWYLEGVRLSVLALNAIFDVVLPIKFFMFKLEELVFFLICFREINFVCLTGLITFTFLDFSHSAPSFGTLAIKKFKNKEV